MNNLFIAVQSISNLQYFETTMLGLCNEGGIIITDLKFVQTVI